MKNNLILKIILIGFFLAGAASLAKPNLIFIMADDHAVSSISAYEDWLADIAPTPNIDRIANEGMLMTRTFL